jgi:hypothetical protein
MDTIYLAYGFRTGRISLIKQSAVMAFVAAQSGDDGLGGCALINDRLHCTVGANVHQVAQTHCQNAAPVKRTADFSTNERKAVRGDRQHGGRSTTVHQHLEL